MRKFTLLDAMALIVAVSIGLAIYRVSPPAPHPIINGSLWNKRSWHYATDNILDGIGLILPILTMLTLSILLLNLRKPRPRTSEPGLIICFVQFAVFIYGACFKLAEWAAKPEEAKLNNVFIQYCSVVSFAVIGAYIALRLAGAWNTEPTWIDRAGRATGLAWILALVVLWNRYFLV